MSQNVLRVGVVGIGHLGKIHTRIYNELEETHLVAICDRNASSRSNVSLTDVPFLTDHKELIGRVDAVSIATPTSTHYEVARDFLAAGVHTLIEKPITLNLKQADELIELAKKNNCALQVGHIERHNPGFRRIEEIANNIRFFEIHRLGPFTARINDCGVVLDLMIHDIDLVLSLVKSELESFDAVGINVLTPYEDIANVRLKFANGAVADVTASRLTPDKQRKMRIFQEDAYISLDFESQKSKIFRKVDNEITQEIIDTNKAEPLKEELRYFIQGIQSGESLGKPDMAARNALELALKIVDQIQREHPQKMPA